MKSKHERQLAKSIANTSFVEVAKLPFVQNKWISTRVWFELYKQKVNMNTELIDHSYFKRTLVATDSFVRNDLSIASECGYYWQASKIPIGGGNHQRVTVILVTEPGRLPRLSTISNWHAKVIISMPTSWCTRSNCITPPPPSQPPPLLLPSPKRSRVNPPANSSPGTPLPTRPQPQPQPTRPQPQPQPTRPQVIHLDTVSQSAPDPFANTTYWDSPEAYKFFGFYKPDNKDDEEYSVRQLMIDRIIKF